MGSEFYYMSLCSPLLRLFGAYFWPYQESMFLKLSSFQLSTQLRYLLRQKKSVLLSNVRQPFASHMVENLNIIDKHPPLYDEKLDGSNNCTGPSCYTLTGFEDCGIFTLNPFTKMQFLNIAHFIREMELTFFLSTCQPWC